MFEKSIFSVVATPASSILIRSSLLILGSNKDNHNILDELNFSQIQPLTAELAALECLKN